MCYWHASRCMVSVVVAFFVATALIGLAGCATAPPADEQERERLARDVEATIARVIARDPAMEAVFDEAHAYAVFPEVVKGGAIVGGAHGQGMAYEGGVFVGYCTVRQGTVGAQLGGQAYSQVVFFHDAAAFERFKAGDVALSAQASAIAINESAATRVEYDRDMQVFIMADRGLMAEATVGGQRFEFVPAE